MKIAIQGHLTRGKEVIQILESLGCKNNEYHGDNPAIYYEAHNNSIRAMCTKSNDYKYYTLEEFEKEFPFKIGDIVFTTVKSTTFKGIVKDINVNDPIYPYLCSFEDSGKCSLGGMNVFVKCKINQLFKMQEKRNITLTLEKAKEWYNKGGELKEIALQAYKESELNILPKTWDEFVNSTNFNFNINVNYHNKTLDYSCNCFLNKSIGESSIICEKHIALFKLEQLRDCWRQGWKPEPGNNSYAIKVLGEKLEVYCYCSREFLSFPTREMAKEFLECFRDLIEQAGDLI